MQKEDELSISFMVTRNAAKNRIYAISSNLWLINVQFSLRN